ncbi:hypothetical protein NDU88_005070 [Pleurodeles waltl]|uniref:Uncharacterized protein n=1 Tax=Pleurodeles waltl TaxID=8319 RepID=A0AAV7SKM6_PLEWA|nr:hypothetical protein NDU88_005070 [Pleurodeles waltl]
MYLPRIQVAFVDLRAMLHEENAFLADWSILLDSLSAGTPGKDPGAEREEHEACTTKFSGVVCLDKNAGSPGATRYHLATDLFTAVEVTVFFHTSIIGSMSASLKMQNLPKNVRLNIGSWKRKVKKICCLPDHRMERGSFFSVLPRRCQVPLQGSVQTTSSVQALQVSQGLHNLTLFQELLLILLLLKQPQSQYPGAEPGLFGVDKASADAEDLRRRGPLDSSDAGSIHAVGFFSVDESCGELIGAGAVDVIGVTCLLGDAIGTGAEPPLPEGRKGMKGVGLYGAVTPMS